MTDFEPVVITKGRLNQIPTPWNEPFNSIVDLPMGLVILDEVFYEPKDPKNPDDKPGEVLKAKNDSNYIGLTDEDLKTKVPWLVADCINEMSEYELAARQPAIERLKKLREIAPKIKRIIVRSAPGDYKHLNKNDRYKDDPAMQGADRLRSDQAAILAIVLAGIKEGWSEQNLLLFLNQHILTNDNEELNELREKAVQTVADSGIRLVYTGREDEIKSIKILLTQKHIFIPKESVDILGPEGIDNTIDQTREFAKYLKDNLAPGDGFIEPINIQGIRSMRMAAAYEMIPSGTSAYTYAMPTSGGYKSQEYKKGEIRGTVFYALTKQASFDPAPCTMV